MNKIFSKRFFNLFCLIYTILTLVVSIYNLILGQNYDYLGYYHEIYRAFFVLFILLLADFISNFSLNKSLSYYLSKLLPLLLTFLAFGALLYYRGDLDIDLSDIRKVLMYVVGFILALILLLALIKTLATWLNNIFKSNKKKYFSFMSLLLLALILLPIIAYHFIFINNNPLENILSSRWYAFGLIFFGLLVFCLLLSTKFKDNISFLTVFFLIIYYIFWFVIMIGRLNIYTFEIMQTMGFITILVYSIQNRFDHCIPISIIVYILIFVGALFFFK